MSPLLPSLWLLLQILALPVVDPTIQGIHLELWDENKARIGGPSVPPPSAEQKAMLPCIPLLSLPVAETDRARLLPFVGAACDAVVPDARARPRSYSRAREQGGDSDERIANATLWPGNAFEPGARGFVHTTCQLHLCRSMKSAGEEGGGGGARAGISQGGARPRPACELCWRSPFCPQRWDVA